MNTQFDPTMLDSSKPMTDDERLLFTQQEEKRIGDENEANGLNRDGSPKAPVTPPTPPVVQTPKVEQGPATLQDVRTTPLGVGMRDAPSADTSVSSESLLIKQKLSLQPKLPIFLPLESGERKGIAYRSVTINGYRFEVKKGVMVYVPKSVHDILVSAMESTADATEIDENLSNADGEKRRALGLE